MKNAVAVIALMLMVSIAQAEPPGLIISNGKYYAATKGPNGELVTEEITQVMNLDKLPPGGGGGTTPTPPPSDGVTDAVATLSKSKLQNSGQAQALAQVLYSTVLKSTDIEQAFDVAIPVVGGSLSAKPTIDAWYAGLKQVPGWSFTKANVQSAINGIVKAFDLDPAILTTFDKAVAAGDPVAAVQADLPEANALDITTIIQLIQSILEILQKLGIFG